MSQSDTNPDFNFSPRKDLYQIFGSTALTKRQKVKVIGNLDEVYGYDLVFVIHLILDTGLSGYLNIVNQKNEISGIVFSNGKITKIDLADRDTLFGQLLIQEGYITLDVLNKFIQAGGTSLGEELISKKVLTKEQFIELLLKQMRMRLSKYINQMMYRINFVESDEGSTLFSIDLPQYLSLAHDWIAGRFENKWLTMHYMEFMSSKISIRDAELGASSLINLPLVKLIIEKNEAILASPNFENLLGLLKKSNEGDLFLKAIHFVTISGYVLFAEGTENSQVKNKSYIQNIYKNMVSKTEVEMLESLASILKLKPTDIDGIYNEINRAIERSNDSDDENIKLELSRLNFDILTRKKFYLEKYYKAYAKNAPQEVDRQLIEQIKTELLEKNFYSAMNKLNKLKNFENHAPKVRLYLIWARVASAVYKKVYIDLKSLDREIIQILPEDKNSADFYFVLSLIAKLKNDKNDLLKYYTQATKLDPKFEKQLLIEDSLSEKIKKMFNRKAVIILLTLFIFDSVNGQSEQSEASTNETANLEIEDSDEVPFKYLNQYFTYSIKADDSVVLNDREYSTKDFKFEKESKLFKFSLGSTLEKIVKRADIVGLSPNGLEVFKVKLQFENGASNYEFNNDRSPFKICLQVKSKQTILRICKPNSESIQNKDGIKEVVADGVSIGNSGQIILQDSKTRTTFQVAFNSGAEFYIETQRRKVYPASINKVENSDQISVRWVDLDRQDLAWAESIKIDQRFFEIKLDPLLAPRQDIYFADPKLKSKSFSRVLIEKQKSVIVTKNKIVINPFLKFSQLVGDNANVSVKLRTGMGFGFEGIYSKNFRPKWDWIVGANLLSTKILFEDTTKQLEGKSQFLYSVSGGAIYHWSRSWDAVFSGGLKSDMFLVPINTDAGVKVVSGLNKFISSTLVWEVFRSKLLDISVPVGLIVNLPGQVGEVKASMGTEVFLAAMASTRLDWGRVFVSTTYGSRKQNFDDFNFKEDYYYMSGGFTYLY